MSAPTASPGANLAQLDYFVEGMDCPTCVRKIEGALERLPGATDAKTNLTTQTLTLTLEETQTPRAALEKNLRALGHEPRLMNGEVGGAHTPRPWYATKQGRLVLTTGTLLALAFLFGLVEPALAPWG